MNNKKEKIYLVFDASGSVDESKIERYHEIYNHYSKDYKCECIIHNTIAKFIDMRDFKQIADGGTYISSGVALAASEILKEYKIGKLVIVGDGDNWLEDNERLYALLNNLHTLGAEIIYHEVYPSQYSTNMSERFPKHLVFDMPMYIVRNKRSDIFGTIKEPEKIAIKTYDVEHKVTGKRYTFISDIENLEKNDIVVCDTSQGLSYGRIVGEKAKLIPKDEIDTKYKKILKFVAKGLEM